MFAEVLYWIFFDSTISKQILVYWCKLHQKFHLNANQIVVKRQINNSWLIPKRQQQKKIPNQPESKKIPPDEEAFMQI